MDALVMKFGGASVSDASCFEVIAKQIEERKKKRGSIIVVVSAMGDTTDQLMYLAKQVHPSPPTREMDMLISVGERISISLLAMALAKRGIEAVSYTGSQSGIITTNEHLNAKIIEVKPQRILSSLRQDKVVIVAGFQGMSGQREITTLGRGGSDTTAVALGVALQAKCVEFYKDVDGIYSKDPHQFKTAEHYPELSFDQALEIVGEGGTVLHSRCIALAQKNNLPLVIRSFLEQQTDRQTWIQNSEKRESNTPIFEQDEIFSFSDKV